MKKNRHFQVCFLAPGITHNDAAKQPALDGFLDVHVMVVERPGANGILLDIKYVAPLFARTDRIAAVGSLVGLNAERPGTIRVDAIMQTMYMKAVRLVVAI